MTIAGLEPGGSQDNLNQGNGLFHVSLARMDQLNRSAIHLIASRLTEACPSYDMPPRELLVGDLIREISEFHGDTDDFIRFDMPIKEIVFRTLLARGNKPIALADLHHELTGRWSNALRPISIEESMLRRVLEMDTYYGFAEA